jgi:hypothetical protein
MDESPRKTSNTKIPQEIKNSLETKVSKFSICDILNVKCPNFQRKIHLRVAETLKSLYLKKFFEFSIRYTLSVPISIAKKLKSVASSFIKGGTQIRTGE